MQIRKAKTTIAVTSLLLTGMLVFSMLIIVSYSAPIAAQQSIGQSIAELRAGKNMITYCISALTAGDICCEL